jgi:choline dehydrogenase
VLAARLTEDGERQVTLLEAGPVYRPSEYPDSITSSSVIGPATGADWAYRSQPGSLGRPISLPRGKVLGGTSAMNAGVAMRALPADFERWSARGLRGWRFSDVLPAYRSVERTVQGSDALHGRAGPLPVSQARVDELEPIHRAFIAAAEAAGLPVNDDFNGDKRPGAGAFPVNNVEGVRVNTGMAFLTENVWARPNLQIRGNTIVDRVVVRDGKVVGVALVDGELPADEVILAAGAFGSPAILLRSGIGPASKVRELGIDLVADLPVGRNLQDHAFYFNSYAIQPDRIGTGPGIAGRRRGTPHGSRIRSGRVRRAG